MAIILVIQSCTQSHTSLSLSLSHAVNIHPHRFNENICLPSHSVDTPPTTLIMQKITWILAPRLAAQINDFLSDTYYCLLFRSRSTQTRKSTGLSIYNM